MKSFLKNKRVFITGACGTIGKELVQQILKEHEPDELIGVDNNESELFFMEQSFNNYKNVHFFLTDVRDKEKLSRKMKGVDIVFHTAALKHVELCEKSPFDAVQTNIHGVQNIIRAAGENRIKKVIFTSSDKAVNPTNVMGTSKLMGERLMTAANSNFIGDGPIFSSTRFGNVIGSRGSVFSVFKQQIQRGGPITLTDPNMTRFIMSIQQAVQLVVNSAELACGGEVFITKMPVINIKDLAEVMIQKLAPVYGYEEQNIELNIIGVKPGEKLYEELINSEETRRAWEIDNYFVVLPAFKNIYRKIMYHYPNMIRESVSRPYNSTNEYTLTKSELLSFLDECNIFDSKLS